MLVRLPVGMYPTSKVILWTRVLPTPPLAPALLIEQFSKANSNQDSNKENQDGTLNQLGLNPCPSILSAIFILLHNPSIYSFSLYFTLPN